MKTALFICDHVSPEYQSQFGDYSDMFAALFPEFDWHLFDVINDEFPKDLNEFDLFMATGSRHSAYEDLDWINQTKELIREIYRLEKYFIGFCFGHQLLGEALGGKVEKSPKGWCVGVHEFEISESQNWMSPFQNSLNLLMMCQDQVVRLPENATLLGGNEKCPVGMFQVGDRMLGIQAHPEFSKDYDRLLMENRIERMGKEIVDEGVRSLEKDVDWELIREWILNFTKK